MLILTSSACGPHGTPRAVGRPDPFSMPRHHQRTSLPYRPDEILDLVIDIERYPEFLPWCTGARVRSREKEGDIEILTADLSVGIKGLHETFTSRVRVDRKSRKVEVEYLNGPFRRLYNRWLVEDGGKGESVVDFFIDFEFRNRLLAFAMDRVFGEAVARMVGAFVDRAHRLYNVQAK
jgi:coenzyme Q-binding protein COQ10